MIAIAVGGIVVIPRALGSGKVRRLGRHGDSCGLKNRQPGWVRYWKKERQAKGKKR